MNSNHISGQNREKSRANIEHKINILKKWSSDGIPIKLDNNGSEVRDKTGELEFEWVPLSILDFSKWDGSQNSSICVELIGQFKTVSRETLNKDYNSDLRSLLLNTLKLVKARLVQQTEHSNKLGTIQKLNLDLKYWELLAKTMATDIAQLKLKNSETEEKVKKLQRALDNNKEETQKLIQAKEEKIQSLLASLNKITKFSALKKE